jgi:uncharacterized integral membrane protein
MSTFREFFSKLLRSLLVLFLVALVWICLSNLEFVSLRWQFIGEWSVPLIWVMLVFFMLGWLVGVLSWLPSRLHLKSQLKKLLHLKEERLDKPVIDQDK